MGATVNSNTPSQQSVFGGAAFDQWANREADRATLNTKEKFLTERFFDKDGPTLDGGTGGGRVLYALQKQGFSKLYGFDFVAESIAAARKRDRLHVIRFDVMDATILDYENNFFGQLIYAEQMICFLEEAAQRAAALQEAYRVLKTGGLAIFTTLLLKARRHSRLQSAFRQHLWLLRKICGSERSGQCLPWLRLGGRWNWSALIDHPPHNYWYRVNEFSQDLQTAGFHIEGIATDFQIKEKRLCPSAEVLAAEPLEGILYAVCRK